MSMLPRSDRPDVRRRRFGSIPVRVLVPNVITLLALCAGLSAIRMSIEGRNELALGAIVFAAILDGIDGRVARMIKGQSRFGAELDSLADFVNFGVTPALILYFWQLHEFNNVGWIAAIIFAISSCLRLARFNTQIDEPSDLPFAANYFTGVPAPLGALCVLLPMYLVLIGLPQLPPTITLLFTLTMAFLMVSRLPVYSGKKLGARVSPEAAVPLVIFVVLFIAVLISYPWYVLSVGSVIYLAALPFSWAAYRRQERTFRAQQAGQGGASANVPETVFTPPSDSESADRPTRLN
ncbi:CDP-alcohol phosphatidyltransferase family protein [Afipia felis]|uniref:CDP-diacylglycerol-serine O-phosphatidyltransferase n=2 Tax=Afipia felis TaxID=1035 RepID=A0A380W9Q0_AFIFE|nr:phosphatidylcholine/phosphatidylserine synthase [Afipia felis]EKS28604.1 CDP-diacylglycerol-serine O-phosphatidyltransferase [Afipia felis ATCC 53690]SUU77312.1 CDP-diacylglycerol-serine O-phosphatidyltransferase [Afipia felis]SUU85379.1 CDP-diacylglycerol-serine O-phosphatidyltransferase [Afipia felis]